MTNPMNRCEFAPVHFFVRTIQMIFCPGAFSREKSGPFSEGGCIEGIGEPKGREKKDRK